MKLVRDHIPSIIEQNGMLPITQIAEEEQYGELLLQKLLEETHELLESPSEEEAADVFEVLKTLERRYGWDIEQARQKKHQERGGFAKGIILKEIVEKEK